MDRVLAIGDIHGCYKTLKSLLFKSILITKQDKIIFLGDYVDRGPDSKKVLKLILDLIKDGFDIECLIGNHEIMLLNSIKSPIEYKNWLKYGGKETLNSFGVLHPKDIKIKYLTFLNKLKYFIELDDFLLVHGGLNFKIENPLEDKESMPWIRNNSVNIEKIGNKRIVVGHTPHSLKDIKKSLNSDRILVDGGCVYKEREDLGYLVALDLKNMDLYYRKNKE